MKKFGIGKHELKKHNRSRILSLIRFNPLPRVEIAEIMGLTKAAVTVITSEMLEEGIITETLEYQTKGKCRKLLSITPHYKYALGAIINENSISLGLSDLSLTPLADCSMEINENTPARTIMSFITAKCSEMIGNFSQNILGIGIGVAPLMRGRLGIFLKDGVLDFSGFCEKISSETGITAICGTSAGLTASAAGDKDIAKAFLHLGKQINLAVVNRDGKVNDFDCYTNLVEKQIVDPNGRIIDGYPRGCVRAELTVSAVMQSLAEIYSAEKTPFLYEITDGDIAKVNFDRVYDAFRRGETAVVTFVSKLLTKFGVLINNIACSYYVQEIILGNICLTNEQFSLIKRIISKIVGHDVAARIILNPHEKSLFLGGCEFIISKVLAD